MEPALKRAAKRGTLISTMAEKISALNTTLAEPLRYANILASKGREHADERFRIDAESKARREEAARAADERRRALEAKRLASIEAKREARAERRRKALEAKRASRRLDAEQRKRARRDERNAVRRSLYALMRDRLSREARVVKYAQTQGQDEPPEPAPIARIWDRQEYDSVVAAVAANATSAQPMGNDWVETQVKRILVYYHDNWAMLRAGGYQPKIGQELLLEVFIQARHASTASKHGVLRRLESAFESKPQLRQEARLLAWIKAQWDYA